MSRPARRPRASSSRAPSAAAARPDTTCPGRSARSRPRRSAASAGGAVGGARALGRSERRGVPLGGVAIGRRHERRLAAHRQPHVAGGEVGVDRAAEREDRRPLRVGVGLGDARRFVDRAAPTSSCSNSTSHSSTPPGDRRGARRLRRARQRDVPFAGEQARRRVEADPAGAGQVDLAPGVQVGEVALGAGGPVERLDVGGRAGSGSRRRSARRARGGAAAARAARWCRGTSPTRARASLRRLHAGLEADDVRGCRCCSLRLRSTRKSIVRRRRAVDARRDSAARRGVSGSACRNGCSSRRCHVLVAERKVLGVRLEEEVERVVDGHLGDQVDLDAELAHLLREREPRDVVALRILLPVEEVLGWRDALRIGQDRRAAVRRRTQADELRRQCDRPVVAVVRHVVKGDVDAQGIFQLYHFSL